MATIQEDSRKTTTTESQASGKDILSTSGLNIRQIMESLQALNFKAANSARSLIAVLEKVQLQE